MDRRRSLIFTAAAATAAIAIGIFVSYEIHWFPVTASKQAANTDRLYHVLVNASIPIFVLVTTVILYCAWRLFIDFWKPELRFAGLSTIQWSCVAALIWYARDAAALLSARKQVTHG